MLSSRFFEFIGRSYFNCFLSFQILDFFKVAHRLFKRYDVVNADIIWVIEWTLALVLAVILVIDVSWVTLSGFSAFEFGLFGGNLSCFDRRLPRGSLRNHECGFGLRFDSLLLFLCCVKPILGYLADSIGLIPNAFCFGLDFLEMIFRNKIVNLLISFILLMLIINFGM